MKKVYVVSKTHLDLGFTDYEHEIRRKYIDEFIPSAISIAEQVNTQNNKRFIWTTGSWIIKEALNNSDQEQRKKLIKALKEGNIAPHALPFTTHSELLDEDTFDYGLSIVDDIDETRGRKTVAAKMTDVPGHTKGIVPILRKHGIKLLHIGVNGSSAIPEVPECFLWRCGNSEIVVIYSGDYGGAFRSDYTDEVLYFDHTVDNRGTPSPNKVIKKLEKIKKEYPDYEVCAGTLDDFAEAIWKVKDKLPVVEGEIGDTWIHGSASDPYKSASLRELMGLKQKWLSDGSMVKTSDEYKNFSDSILCLGEHTCGMDSKIYLADYENYLKEDFRKARKNDEVTVKHPFKKFPKGFIYRSVGKGKKRSYSIIEKSWQEKRAHIENAVNSLSAEHNAEAKKALARLKPESPCDISAYEKSNSKIRIYDFEFELNEFGGVGELTYKGNRVIKKNNKPLLEYRSYASKDYDFWFTHYSRNMKENGVWAYPDFGKPLLECYGKKYPNGRFFYSMTDSRICNTETGINIYVNLECDKELTEKLGAPRKVQVIYTLYENGLGIDLSWYEKDANRLPEALFLHLYPNAEEFTLVKMGSEIDYNSTVSMGGRNLHAVNESIMKSNGTVFEILNIHSPLISIGQGKILEFDNKTESLEKDGISYVLCNNVWGTNFPLWYEDNARFEFRLEKNS
ncbi:MAG: DUF5054 domain-containing protein [Acutalibacteraceae bacterium]